MNDLRLGLIRHILDEAYYERIAWLMRVIKERDFGQKHIDTVTSLVSKLKNHLSVEQDDFRGTNAATLSSSAASESFTFYQKRGRYYQPCTIDFGWAKNYFNYEEQWSPVAMNLDEISLGTDANKTVTFNSVTAEKVVAIAQALSKILGQSTSSMAQALNTGRAVPVCIVEGQRLYICHARQIEAGAEDADLHIIRRREQGLHKSHDQKPFWEPKVRIFIDSFVSVDKLNAEQYEYFKEYKGFLESKTVREGLVGLQVLYSTPAILDDFTELDALPEHFQMATSSQMKGKAMKTGTTAKKEEMIDQLAEFKRCVEVVPRMEEAFKKFMLSEAWLGMCRQIRPQIPSLRTIETRRPRPLPLLTMEFDSAQIVPPVAPIQEVAKSNALWMTQAPTLPNFLLKPLPPARARALLAGTSATKPMIFPGLRPVLDKN